MQRIEFLSKSPLFSVLSDQQLEQMAGFIHEKEFEEGEFIVKDKDNPESLCLLAAGRVKLTKYSHNGREQIVHIFNQGEMMGLCTLFTRNLFPANAVAMEKTRVYLISKRKLETIAYNEPPVLLNLVFALSGRLAESMSMIESLALQKVHQRVASFIAYSLSHGEDQQTMTLPFNQQELAHILGATPESLSRVFKKMKDDGIISMEGRLITVEDRDGLNAIVEEG